MRLKSRCFPLEYYPGEILTEVEARRRRNPYNLLYPSYLESVGK